jgi:hypothetical protein
MKIYKIIHLDGRITPKLVLCELQDNFALVAHVKDIHDDESLNLVKAMLGVSRQYINSYGYDSMIANLFINKEHADKVLQTNIENWEQFEWSVVRLIETDGCTEEELVFGSTLLSLALYDKILGYKKKLTFDELRKETWINIRSWMPKNGIKYISDLVESSILEFDDGRVSLSKDGWNFIYDIYGELLEDKYLAEIKEREFEREAEKFASEYINKSLIKMFGDFFITEYSELEYHEDIDDFSLSDIKLFDDFYISMDGKVYGSLDFEDFNELVRCKYFVEDIERKFERENLKRDMLTHLEMVKFIDNDVVSFYKSMIKD